MTFLQQQPFVNDRVGLIGFCSGGRAALIFACSTSGLRVFVNCYSNGIVLPNEVNPVPAIDRVKELSCPMLGLFGADDTNPSPADVERLRQALERHGKPHEIVIYPQAPHAFFSDTRPSYRPETSQMAWGRMLEWFSRHVKPEQVPLPSQPQGGGGPIITVERTRCGQPLLNAGAFPPEGGWPSWHSCFTGHAPVASLRFVEGIGKRPAYGHDVGTTDAFWEAHLDW